jgi:HlyD family secretion protein
MKRVIIIVIILAALVGAYFGWRYWQQSQQSTKLDQYQTVAASRGSLIDTVGATGVVRANQSAILTWQTTGTIEQVEVAAGELVSESQVLASLSTTSLPQSVILAQGDLESARKSLDDLYINTEIARTNALREIATYAQAVRNAQYQLDNFTIPTNQAEMSAIEALDLMKEKLDDATQAFDPYRYYPVDNATRKQVKEALDLAQSDYNAAVRRLEYEYNLDVANANMNKSRQDYENWKDGPDPADIAAIEARIAAAQATLDLAQLTAPFTSTVTVVDLKPGDQVSPGQVAFRLDDLTHLLVDVQISEVDINRIQEGQGVSLTFDAITDAEYQGLVTDVAKVGTNNQGVVDFTVTVELTDADDAVKPGMTAAVNIVVNQLEDVLLVPNRAVRLLEGQRAVYTLVDGELRPVKITLGASSDVDSQVLDGDLLVGDLIVLNPPSSLIMNGPPPWVQR